MTTTTAAAAVRAIRPEDVHKICSGQVIVSLCSAVKELIENALDAKPQSRIEVRLTNHGFDSFEVVDDGPGIPLDDRANVCLKHFTSKLTSFEDLNSVQTFGFRGEALSSLCETAGSVTITTRCAGEEQGAKLQYDRAGVLQSSTPIARGQIGTTVSVHALFSFLPVRRLDFERKLKRHYTDLLHLLQAYAICIPPGIKFSVTNLVNKVRSSAISTQGGSSHIANIASVFGSSFSQELIPIDFSFQLAFGKGKSTDWFSDSQPSSTGEEMETHEVRFTGFVSKAAPTTMPRASMNNADRQFFYLNGRPVEMKRFVKAANECWKLANVFESSKPACIVDVVLPLNTGSFDVNLSPDKREIFMAKEGEILEQFRQMLSALWMPSNSCAFETQALIPCASAAAALQSNNNNNSGKQGVVEEEEEKRLVDQPKHVSPTAVLDMPLPSPHNKPKPEEGLASSAKRSRVDEMEDECEEEEEEKEEIDDAAEEDEEKEEEAPRRGSRTLVATMPPFPPAPLPAKKFKQSSILDFKFDLTKKPVVPEEQEEEEVPPAAFLAGPTTTAAHAACCNHNEHAQERASSCTTDMVDLIDNEVEDELESAFTINFGSAQDLLQAESEWAEASARRFSNSTAATPNLFSNANIAAAAATTTTQTDAAESVDQVLEGKFLKSYFRQADIIGQFNLGFIIARIHDELFIFDQHASDEKFRFETLQQSTTIHEQPLIAPLPIAASAVERQTIRDYEYVFNANGFHFTHEEGADGDDLMLTRVPHSKQTQFGISDVRELAVLLRENPPTDASTTLPRLSKLRAMFASRACRSAVMIGDALTAQQMSRIVANLERLEQPWNCPHGRPTLRHLLHLPDLYQQQQGFK